MYIEDKKYCKREVIKYLEIAQIYRSLPSCRDKRLNLAAAWMLMWLEAK